MGERGVCVGSPLLFRVKNVRAKTFAAMDVNIACHECASDAVCGDAVVHDDPWCVASDDDHDAPHCSPLRGAVRAQHVVAATSPVCAIVVAASPAVSRLALVAVSDDATPSSLRKRGRPPGTRGTPQERRFLRQRRAERGESTPNAQIEVMTPSAPAAEDSEAPLSLGSFMKELGGQAHRAIYDAVSRQNTEPEAHVLDWTDKVLGSVPRRCQPLGAECDLLKKRRNELQDDILKTASIIHFGTRLFVGSQLSNIRRLIDAGRYRGLCTLLHGAYDATPIWIRGLLANGALRESPEQVTISIFVDPFGSAKKSMRYIRFSGSRHRRRSERFVVCGVMSCVRGA